MIPVKDEGSSTIESVNFSGLTGRILLPLFDERNKLLYWS